MQEIWTQTGITKTFMNLYRYMKMKKDNKQFEEDLKSFTSFFSYSMAENIYIPTDKKYDHSLCVIGCILENKIIIYNRVV